MEDRLNRIESKIDSLITTVDRLNLRVGVLHEDVKSDFRFTLEAQEGLKEQMEAGFAAPAQTLVDTLAPIEAAVRSAHGNTQPA